jgi:hypothetical protein
MRVARGVGLGAVAATLVVVGRQSRVLDGLAGLALAALLLLAVPTSRLLSRRILLTGTLALGWLPILWWWRMPTAGAGRVTLLLATTAAALTWWVAADARPGQRLRRLVPRTGWADAVPLGALVGAAAMLWPWLRVRSGTSALAMLATGWDHSAHFNMTEMVRTHSVVIGGAAAPAGGGTWSYVHYPQGYHTVAAALMELMGSAFVGTPASEVALYSRAMGLVALIAIVVVTAGIAATPALRRRPAAAAGVATVVGAAFLCGPGAFVLSDGFPNFFLACALLATVPLIAIPAARWSAPLPFAALGGALVGIAHSWALLLSLAVPVAIVMLLPFRRSRARASRGRWLLLAAIALASATAALEAVVVIRVQPLSSILTLGGGVNGRGLRELMIVVLLAFAFLGLLAVFSRRPWPHEVVRTVWTAAGLAAGVGFASWIAAVEVSQGGLGYYFWKYGIALELLAAVLGAMAAGILVARLRGAAGAGAPVLVRVMVAAVALLVVISVAQPTATAGLPSLISSGAASRSGLVRASHSDDPVLTELLAASSVAPPRPRRSVYLPLGSTGSPNAASDGQWYVALSGTWTDDVNSTIGILLKADLSPDAGPALARRVLSGDATIVVVVAPQYAAAVRSGVEVQDRDRVLTW